MTEMTASTVAPMVGDEIPSFLIISQEARAAAWASWGGFEGGIPAYHDPVAVRQAELLELQRQHAERNARSKLPERLASLDKQIATTDERDHAKIKWLTALRNSVAKKIEGADTCTAPDIETGGNSCNSLR